MKITVLVDNSERDNWQSEHGLALALEVPEGILLFDTGSSGEALLNNLRQAEIALGQIHSIVLSHGHYDHTGGLGVILPKLPQAEIFCGVGVAKERYSMHKDRPVKNLSMPNLSVMAMEQLPKQRVHFVENFADISPEILLAATIMRNSFEDCGGPFFLDNRGEKQDLILDEISLLTKSGVLIQGCAHAGIINTVEHCRKNHSEIKIKTIIGGLHLLHASMDRLEKTVEYLNSLNLEKIILLHCTGAYAMEFLKEKLNCEVVIGRTGDCYEL